MPEHFVRIGEFRLDLINDCLWHGANRIHQTPKDFAVLRYLVANHGRLVRKEEILHAVWSNTVVSEGSLKVCIRRIRQVLNDNPIAPRFIETQARRGYWFIAPVQDHDRHSLQRRRPIRRSIVGSVSGKS